MADQADTATKEKLTLTPTTDDSAAQNGFEANGGPFNETPGTATQDPGIPTDGSEPTTIIDQTPPNHYLRDESLRLSLQFNNGNQSTDADTIIENARKFEAYLRG